MIMNSVTKLCDELQDLKISENRNSRRILDIWRDIRSSSLNFGYSVLKIYEQVFIAALDCGNEEVAKECLIKLKENFPESNRVCRLYGMLLEFKSSFNEALEVYKLLAKIDPSNSLALKRIVAVYKSQGKTNEAIEELIKFLKLFCVDSEAWNELMHLYLGECEFKRAAFCCEELILISPENYSNFIKYAEIKYTEGGHENYELVKSYYCQALILNPLSLRAAYGLFMTLNHLISPSELKSLVSNYTSTSKSDQTGLDVNLKDKKEPNNRLMIWVLQKISEIEAEQRQNFRDDFKTKEKLFLKSLNSPAPPLKTFHVQSGKDQTEIQLRNHFQKVLAKKNETHELTESQKLTPESKDESSGGEESSDSNENYDKINRKRMYHEQISSKKIPQKSR